MKVDTLDTLDIARKEFENKVKFIKKQLPKDLNYYSTDDEVDGIKSFKTRKELDSYLDTIKGRPEPMYLFRPDYVEQVVMILRDEYSTHIKTDKDAIQDIVKHFRIQ